MAEFAGHPFGPSAEDVKLAGARFPLADIRLLARVLPSKIVAIGRNYEEHARETGSQPPVEPLMFLKPSTAVIGPGDAIARQMQVSQRVDFEGGLAIVFGRLCREVPPERVPEVIFGWCANDVTARDLQAATASEPGRRNKTRSVRWARGSTHSWMPATSDWPATTVDEADLKQDVGVPRR